MQSPSLFNDSNLQKMLRYFSPTDMIFTQGQKGNTMYLVVEGLIRVFSLSNSGQLLISIIGPGDILGEKAILQEAPYERNFCAQAKTSTVLLEVDHKNIEHIQAKWPDFNIKMFRMISERLDKANKLIVILQQREPMERFIQYIHYYAAILCVKQTKGMPIIISVNEIRYGANLEKDFVLNCLKPLIKKKIFTAVEDKSYAVNFEAFENYSHFLAKNVAA